MNNNNNNNNNNSRNQQQKQEEAREEQYIIERFRNVAINKLEQVAFEKTSSSSSTAKEETNNSLKFGNEEQQLFSKLTSIGVKEGIIASIASFIVLRRGPKYITQWIFQRNRNTPSSSSSSSSSSYQLSDPKKLTNATLNNKTVSNNNNNPFETAKMAGQQYTNIRGGFISRSIWFVFDSVLSLLVGANISLYYTDTKAIKDDIVSLPLLAGTSLIADTVCDELVQEWYQIKNKTNNDRSYPTYQRLMKKNATNNNNNNINSNLYNSTTTTEHNTAAALYMQGITQFCMNCQRRRCYEKNLRDEQQQYFGDTNDNEEYDDYGNNNNNTTSSRLRRRPSIPSPGVPKDYPRLVVDPTSGNEHIIRGDGDTDDSVDGDEATTDGPGYY